METYTDVTDDLLALRDENERLRAEIEQVREGRAITQALWDKSIDLNERLRAALQRIESYGKWELTEDDAYSMQRIASEALNSTK